MNPVLIYTDQARIDREILALQRAVPLYQSVYTAAKAVGIQNVTIQEVDNLIQFTMRQNQSDFVGDYVVNKLLQQAGPTVINGITLNQAALKNMMAIPDFSGIKAALQQARTTTGQGVFLNDISGIRTDLLQLVNNVISEVNNANAVITAKYQFYASTDVSISIATSLQAVCDALNAHDALQTGYTQYIIKHDDYETVLPGLKVVNGLFCVSERYIQKLESLGITSTANSIIGY